jgi:hypothetical protein
MALAWSEPLILMALRRFFRVGVNFGCLGFEPRMAVSYRLLWRAGTEAGELECPGGGAVCDPSFNYTLTVAFHLSKITMHLNQVRRKVLAQFVLPTCTYLLPDFQLLSPTASGDFDQPSVGTGAFQLSERRGSNSRLVLWCGRKKPELPNPLEFVRY